MDAVAGAGRCCPGRVAWKLPGGGIGCAGAAIRDACKSGCPVLAGWGGLNAAGRGHWVRRAGVHSMAGG